MGVGARQARVLVCGVVLFVAGCSSRGGDAPGGRPDAAGGADAGDAGGPPDGAADGAADAVAAFFAQYQTGYCGFLAVCGDAPDLATCNASWQTFLPWFPPQVLKDVGSGAVVYDPAAARACLAAFDNPACTQTWYAGWIQMSQVCSGVFTGTLPIDSDCFLDVECAGHAICLPTHTGCSPATGCCAGTCVADQYTRIPLNASCPMANDVLSACVDGSYCAAGPGGTATCQPLITTVGAACAGLRECAAPLYCKHDPMTVSGVCAQPSPPGGACHPSADEESLSCESLLTYCNLTTATCDAVVPVGGSCGVSSVCTSDASCAAGTVRTCDLLPKLGEACVPGSSCLLSLTCDPTSNTCVLPAAPPMCG